MSAGLYCALLGRCDGGSIEHRGPKPSAWNIVCQNFGCFNVRDEDSAMPMYCSAGCAPPSGFATETPLQWCGPISRALTASSAAPSV